MTAIKRQLIPREIEPHLLHLSKMYPIVTVTGPRQSGKTTLVRKLFPDFDYVNLEIPDVREEAQNDPRGFLLRHPAPAIFDEIQRTPPLLSYLQAIVDEVGNNSMYVLTGNHQPSSGIAHTISCRAHRYCRAAPPLYLRMAGESRYCKERDQWILDGFMPTGRWHTRPNSVVS